MADAVAAPALHVFVDEDSMHWVVAASAEDAVAWANGEWGEDRERESWGRVDFWTQLPDDKPLRIAEDDGPRSPAVILPCGEWARREGRGFLCGTES